MKEPRFNELFQLFFDPKAPILFVIGSIALGVLGNAVYTLLTGALGVSDAALAGIIVGATLIFALTVLLFRWLVRRLGRIVRPNVSNEELAAPHSGLILLVGANPSGSESRLIAWHAQQRTLRHCWLVVSPQVQHRIDSLEFELRERNAVPHRLEIGDVNQAGETYRAVRDGLIESQRLLRDAPVIVDITGGTKPMTAGAVLACLELDAPMEYLASVRLPDGRPDPQAETQPMLVRVLEPPQEVSV